MTSIALTAAQRESLVSLIDIQALSDRTQLRLSTGRKVNSASDDAVSFFRARSLSDRAKDFAVRSNDIAQGIQSLEVTINAISSIDTLLRQLRGIAESTRAQTAAERNLANEQFGNVLEQINLLVDDASYQGLNLLNGTNNQLDVRFGILTSSRLTVGGLNLNTTGTSFGDTNLFSVVVYSTNGNVFISNLLGGTLETSFTNIGAANSNVNEIEGIIQRIDNAISRARAQSSELGTNSAILATRGNFTERYINSLDAGSDNLVLADLNEEGANIVVLQTRQQLAINSLSLAGREQQNILQLIRG